MALTPKQEMFVKEYLIDLNGNQAAIRAGYSEKTARITACDLLTNPNIQEALQKAMEERSKRTEITADKVLKEMAHIAFDDIGNYLSFKTVKTVVARDKETDEPIIGYQTVVDVKDSADIDTRSIAEVSTGKDGVFRFKMYCKDAALVQLGKHLGLFNKEIQEHTGPNGGPIHIKDDRTAAMSAEELKAAVLELIAKDDPDADKLPEVE